MRFRFTIDELIKGLIENGYLLKTMEAKHLFIAEAILRTCPDLRAELEAIVLYPTFGAGEES